MNHELLEKYFNGECSSEESASIEKWLKEVEMLPEAKLRDEDISVKQRVAEKLNYYVQSSPKGNGLRYITIAASLLLVSGVALFFRYQMFGNDKLNLNAVVWKSISVPDGKKAAIKLSDGSTIELNGGSSMSYPEKFAQIRNVKLLKGDAFFSVTKDPQHPFVVTTDSTSNIRVLGTRFNVKHNAYASRLEITLNSGKISFERKGQKAQAIVPGQQLYYNLKTASISHIMQVDTTESNAWRKNTLLFKDSPLPQVFREIEQLYGVTFKGIEQNDQQLFNAEFSKEPLSRILSLLEKSTKLRFKQKGSVIQVYSPHK